MVKYDYDTGFRGVRQIFKSVIAYSEERANELLERHTQHLLNRTMPDWVK